MKTDKKTMSLVLRRAAQNIDRGLKPFKDIQYLGHYGAWIDMVGFDIDENVEYRIKPKTIIVNGVEIPKPLDVGEINNLEHDSDCYCPSLNSKKYNNFSRSLVIRSGEKLIYATKEEAIEASKRLFGIE